MFDTGFYSPPYERTYDADLDYYPDTSLSSYINITHIDLDNKIVSGLFEFHLISEDSSKSVVITEGRFDVGAVNIY